MSMLDERIRELIALGASVAANCVSCLEYHLAKARDAGAGPGEIAEAIETGRLVREGAARKLDRVAARPVGDVPVTAASGDCGCSAPSAAAPRP